MILFLSKFLGLYLVLNLAYGLFIEYYTPDSDPFTQIITSQVVFFLSFFDPLISSQVIPGLYYIKVQHESKTIISVFEGCNGLNVMIVYVSFLFSFTGPLKLSIRYLIFGMGVIYAMNLIRVMLLYEVAIYFPQNLYFFHKYFFTGVLYILVFALWYFWVKKITKVESGTAAAQA